MGAPGASGGARERGARRVLEAPRGASEHVLVVASSASLSRVCECALASGIVPQAETEQRHKELDGFRVSATQIRVRGQVTRPGADGCCWNDSVVAKADTSSGSPPGRCGNRVTWSSGRPIGLIAALPGVKGGLEVMSWTGQQGPKDGVVPPSTAT